MAETDQAVRRGQEGNRWVNYRPTGEEVAAWFRENVALHDADLDHDRYVQGITLIQQEAKEKEVVGFTDEGAAIIDERKNLYYVPYAKVETRVRYFWDFVNLREGQWLGVIEPVEAAKPVSTLPIGFGSFSVRQQDGHVANFITYSARARILERDTIEEKLIRNVQTGEMQKVITGKEVMSGAPGTKAVAMLGRFGADPNAVMKAETGAVGRALGLLGMLIVPGSGVATAEDVQESLQAEGVAPAAPEQQQPEQAQIADDDAALRQRVVALLGELEKADRARHEEFRRWAREDRKIALHEASQPQLRGLIRKLDEEIAEARKGEGAEAQAEG